MGWAQYRPDTTNIVRVGRSKEGVWFYSYLPLKYFVFVGVMDNLPTLLVFSRKLAWQLTRIAGYLTRMIVMCIMWKHVYTGS